MADIRYQVFEVFGQVNRGEPHVHVGSLLASDADMALILARENFLRRQEYVSLWVAPRSAFRLSPDDPAWYRPSTDKTYRMGVGYRETVRKWRRFGAYEAEAAGGEAAGGAETGGGAEAAGAEAAGGAEAAAGAEAGVAAGTAGGVGA